MTGIPAADEIIEEQGWDSGTLLELLVSFVKDGNHVGVPREESGVSPDEVFREAQHGVRTLQ